MFSKRPIRTLAPKDQIPKWVSGLLYFQQEGTRSGQCPLAMRREVLKHCEFLPGHLVPPILSRQTARISVFRFFFGLPCGL